MIEWIAAFFSVFIVIVAAAAVVLGRWLLKRVRLSIIRYVGVGVCAILATLTVISAM